MDKTKIEDFADYRDFLKLRFGLLRAANPRISMQVCATRMNVSKSYVKAILDKKRQLALDRIPDAARAFSVSESDFSFFVFLVCKCTVNDLRMKQYFSDVLQFCKNKTSRDQPGIC